MNIVNYQYTLLTAGITLLISACTSIPTRYAGADPVTERLNLLESNQELASQAPMAMTDARAAVLSAQQYQKDPADSAHLLYIAERRVDIAEAESQRRYLEQQRKELSAERDAMQLQARTNETKWARLEANQAKADSLEARGQAEQAQSDSASAQRDLNIAEQDVVIANKQVTKMQHQLKELHARKDARGTVVTLGDVLFDFSKADINPNAISHLAKLAAFLNTNSDRIVTIEGHTDNTGDPDFNVQLSQRRADAVKEFLQSQGVAGQRLQAVGKGSTFPVNDNTTIKDRQQNRRVEVIITDPITE
tara:strand:- start:11599 stop:12516 length:918 start_codon:yes stop_codon:yes gene_type:complete